MIYKGCYDALQRLLQRCAFDPQQDQLWLAGDLVNRGPQSLQVLRFVQAAGGSCQSGTGQPRSAFTGTALQWRQTEKSDTIQDILQAPDREQLLDWLRLQPLVGAG